MKLKKYIQRLHEEGEKIKEKIRKNCLATSVNEDKIHYFLETIGLPTNNEVFFISEEVVNRIFQDNYQGERGLYLGQYDIAIAIREKNKSMEEKDEVYIHELLHSISGRVQYVSEIFLRNGYKTMAKGHIKGVFLEEGYAQFLTQEYFLQEYGKKPKDKDICNIAGNGIRKIVTQNPEIKTTMIESRFRGGMKLEDLNNSLNESFPNLGKILLEVQYGRKSFVNADNDINNTIVSTKL